MKPIYRIVIPILALGFLIGGYYWIRTPHLSPGITLNCETSETPEQLAKLVFVKEPYDNYEAYLFAQKYAGFSGYTWGRSSIDRHELYFGLYNLTFYGIGMRHFEFNMPFKERYEASLLTEAQCIEKADQLINDLKDYFNSSLEYRVKKVEQVYPYTDPNGITSLNIRYYKIFYDIYYGGVELLGKGTDGWVEVCDEEILGYQLHFPILEERGYDKVYLTPIEALNRLEEGSVVDEVKLGYYTDFLDSENYSDIEYGYLINGVLEGDLMQTFVSAMARDAYK